mgnify:CR=1 FL=1
MIKLYIPYTPRFLAVNLGLFLLTKEHQDWFKYDTKIESTYGSFAHCIWNGGRTLYDDHMTPELINDTILMYNSLGIRFRLTFTNSFVSDKELNDELANKILDIASESGINEILVNNNLIEKYIRSKYNDKFEFIQSVTKCERNIDNINEACKKYKLVVIDYRDNRNDNFLSKIIDKSKAEIMINDVCNFYCTQRLEHHQDIQKIILTDMDVDKAREIGFQGITCPYKIHYSGKISLDEFDKFVEDDKTGLITEKRLSEMYDMGFRNFKVVGRDFDAAVVALNYAYYLAKDEYKQKFLGTLLYTSLETILESLEKYYTY